MEISNPKIQIPNKLQESKFQKSSAVAQRQRRDWNLARWNLFGIWILGFGFFFLSGCAHRPAPAPASVRIAQLTSVRIAQLTSALTALDPSVDVHDAAILAKVATETSSELATTYRVRPPAWLHNIYVNNGWRDRGLCWHWAEDLQARLAQEHLTTLEIHRVIARRGTRREHSGLGVTARGQDISHAVVLDAWRESGNLVWAAFAADKYPWVKMTNGEPAGVTLNSEP
jgi:hypothetical protein